ncbi:xylogen-like protein 11 [Cajanus cajan]|uniref:Xylogen-like protein 11 n=1 Tax=Cajanus cajan TaxID=3821 RepID=A0A151RB75_CAJCA|nr:xylogen-like protein 11 [Cajanus cajan]KYP39880.1 Xylogen-like protein 11 [Cajanus cajan]
MAASTTTTRVMIVVTLVLTLACCATSAPSPAPETAAAPTPESNGCLMALTNMSDCLTYVEDGSKQAKPDKGCCPELAGLIDSNPICLCELLGKPESIGIKIDLNKALKLPSVCGVSTPPVSTCSAVGVPVSLPPSLSEGPASSSIAPGASSPSNTNAPSPGGPGPSEAASANPSDNKNGALSFQASSMNFIFGLSTLFVSLFF